MVTEVDNVRVLAVGVDPDVKAGVRAGPLLAAFEVEDEHVGAGNPRSGVGSGDGGRAGVSTDSCSVEGLTDYDNVAASRDCLDEVSLIARSTLGRVDLSNGGGVGNPVGKGALLGSGDSVGASS